MTETGTVAVLRKTEESLRAICHEMYHPSMLFFYEDSLVEPFAAL